MQVQTFLPNIINKQYPATKLPCIMYSPKTGISSFPTVVCQTLSLLRSVCRISEGAEGAFRWRGRTVAVSITCVEKQRVASLKFKTPKDSGGSVLQRCALRSCSCWQYCLPFTCPAPGWDHLPTDSCPLHHNSSTLKSSAKFLLWVQLTGITGCSAPSWW